VNGFLLVVSSLLAVATAMDVVTAPALYGAAALLAGASAFDNPARNALYPSLIPNKVLSDAVVLQGASFQVAATLGPACGGLLIAYAGIPWVYACDAASFAFIVWQLRPIAEEKAAASPSSRSDLSFGAALEGLRFVFGNPLIRNSMLLDFFAGVLASATTLLPIFSQDVLKVGAEGYGLLASAMALGSLSAAILLSGAVQRSQRRGLVLLAAVAGFGITTFLFGCSHWFWVSWLCLFSAGAFDMVSTVIRQLIRTLETPDELRGRMAGVNLLFFQGGPQLGEFEAGVTAHLFGLQLSVALGGLACVGLAAWSTWHSAVLRNYRATEP
jgi:MFS family permease